MCGRYAQTLPPEAIQSLFRTRNLIDSVPRYNIAPTQPIIAVWEEAGHRDARLARWGLVPRWVKDPREFPLLVNARSETMATKPAFRDAVKHHRCVVPASGYYEWHTGPGGKKQPYYITLKGDEPLALAGLYSTWVGPEGEEVDSAALITVPANPDVAYIHDRMPAILDPQAMERWLDVRGTPVNEAAALILPAPEGKMAAFPVSTRVNSARNDGADLIAPITLEAPAAEISNTMKVKTKNSRQFDLF